MEGTEGQELRLRAKVSLVNREQNEVTRPGVWAPGRLAPDLWVPELGPDLGFWGYQEFSKFGDSKQFNSQLSHTNCVTLHMLHNF